jgi:hypothetical protein
VGNAVLKQPFARGQEQLQQEIDKARIGLHTDGYAMSIGEWMSLYERRELDIHPEFQRLFRWRPQQKSRLIESILLGIPVPQIFVVQRGDGVWDVVDGHQRLSTILEFAGLLLDQDGELVPPLVLEATEYLPALEGRLWQHPDPQRSLTTPQQLIIKRAKIAVSIILKESDPSAKYELFQRLNTGGSMLSDQEVRNALLLMVNPDFYGWIKTLCEDSNFQNCIALSERAIEERYDMELVLRFVAFRRMIAQELSKIGDLGDFLTNRSRAFAQDKMFGYRSEEQAFRETFALLSSVLGDDAFRRYDGSRKRFAGGFSVSAFEALAIGVGFDPKKARAHQSSLLDRVKEMWSESKFVDNSGSGVRASSRVPKVVPYGRAKFVK